MRDAKFWRDYLAQRKGTYEYRTRRYGAVADELEWPEDLQVREYPSGKGVANLV